VGAYHLRSLDCELDALDLSTIYTFYQALISGRPPSVDRRHVDVKLPIDGPKSMDTDPNHTVKKHMFSQAFLWPVLEFCLSTTKGSSYAFVTQMDSKIRQFALPPDLKKLDTQKITEDVEITRYKDTASLFFREITLLSLHRCEIDCISQFKQILITSV
jgi:hypothetical protein